MTFKRYRRTNVTEMEPWMPGTNMGLISISAADRADGSPKPGDMIARNQKNHGDKWLVAKQYFLDNFEEIE